MLKIEKEKGWEEMLSDAYKRKLNILISFYRIHNYSETKNQQWTQKYFYKNDTIPICSTSTYCAIERNERY